ncbi:MAG: mechanosensitive ion channel [Kiritimatiellaeota bacterium]|nr:mechanosensitive ion channel [Kiritimatiellota bacterium]
MTLRLLREKLARLRLTQKGRRDAEEVLALNRQRREGLAAALALSQEKQAHLDAEEALVNRRSSGLKSLFRGMPLISSGNVEKKYLLKRVVYQQQQLVAMDEIIGLNTKLRDLLDCEAACLQEERATLFTRFEQRLLWPVGILGALLVGYLLFSRALVPRLMAKGHHVMSRRMAGYLCGFVSLVVLVTFFFEDLRSVATILGIASAAVVIALQDMCSAFAGWFVIMSGRKVAIGHRVEIDGTRGDVIDIQLLRTTLIEIDNWLGVDEPTGRIIVVPNNFVFRSKFFNYTYLHPYIWSKLDITVTFETPASEAEALLRRVLEEETSEEFVGAREAAKNVEQHYGVPDAVYQPKLYVYIADSGVQYRLVYCAHYRRVGATRNRINARIIREFEANPRLQFAYPTERHIPTPEKGGLHVALDQPI